MSGYRLHDSAALPAGLVAPFLVALALVPFRTELSATTEALIMVVVVVAVAALGTRVRLTAGAARRSLRVRQPHRAPPPP
ncbi:hypothetical protein [Streptomyces sp. NPDC054901]